MSQNYASFRKKSVQERQGLKKGDESRAFWQNMGKIDKKIIMQMSLVVLTYLATSPAFKSVIKQLIRVGVYCLLFAFGNAQKNFKNWSSIFFSKGHFFLSGPNLLWKNRYLSKNVHWRQKKIPHYSWFNCWIYIWKISLCWLAKIIVSFFVVNAFCHFQAPILHVLFDLLAIFVRFFLVVSFCKNI